jgi:hypothetical protein
MVDMINPPRHQAFKPFVDYIQEMNVDVHPRIKASYCRNLIRRLSQSALFTHVDLLSRFHLSAWLEEQAKNAETSEAPKHE